MSGKRDSNPRPSGCIRVGLSVSALIMGLYHVQNAANIGLMVAAFLVLLAIQAGRVTLAFFSIESGTYQKPNFLWGDQKVPYI